MRVRTKPYFPSVTGIACLTDASAGLACLGVASDMTPEEVASLLSNCMYVTARPHARIFRSPTSEGLPADGADMGCAAVGGLVADQMFLSDETPSAMADVGFVNGLTAIGV